MNIYISLIITMVFSAFFSGMEIAFVSVDKLRFEMERKGGVTSRILSVFFKNPNEFISTMLVGNNIALVIYGILMAQIIGDNLLSGFIENHFLMVLAQTVISTLIILVTGEFLPKTLFKINPNLVLNVFAVPLIVCYIILYPVSKLSSGLSCLFLRIFGMKVNKEASDIAFGKVDLDYFVQSSIDNAENEEELDTEVKIFQNALDFSNIKNTRLHCSAYGGGSCRSDNLVGRTEKPFHRVRYLQDNRIRREYRQCSRLYPFFGNVSRPERLARQCEASADCA